MIQRFGQTVPQLFVASRVQNAPRKKPFLQVSYALYFLIWLFVFFAFSTLSDRNPRLLLWIFFSAYVLFWLNMGAYNVLHGIILGKVIPFKMRGRLIGISGGIGGISSILITFLLIRPVFGKYPEASLAPFALFFLICAGLFFIAWICLFWIREPELKDPEATRRNIVSYTRRSLKIVGKDKNFIRFFFIGGIAMSGYAMLPFYTMYAKSHLGVSDSMLAVYLAFQVGANSCGSIIYGLTADRHGNRGSIRMIMFFLACTPLYAILVGNFVPMARAEWWYCFVFVLVGFNLPIYKISINYLLEISPVEKHPNYLSVYNAFACLFLIVPVACGFLMDRFYYHKVFLGVSCLLATGFFLTGKLIEPRHAGAGKEYKKGLTLG